MSRFISARRQRDVVLLFLKRGPKTMPELRAKGVLHPATHISRLRKLGHDIRTERVNVDTPSGKGYRGVALYSLQVGEVGE